MFKFARLRCQSHPFLRRNAAVSLRSVFCHTLPAPKTRLAIRATDSARLRLRMLTAPCIVIGYVFVASEALLRTRFATTKMHCTHASCCSRVRGAQPEVNDWLNKSHRATNAITHSPTHRTPILHHHNHPNALTTSYLPPRPVYPLSTHQAFPSPTRIHTHTKSMTHETNHPIPFSPTPPHSTIRARVKLW